MVGEMCQKQSVDLFRHLVGSIMADARQSLELVGGCDEFTGSFGRRASNGVILVAPDEQGRHFGRTHRLMTHASRPIPSQRGLHSLRVADDGQVALNRGKRHTVLNQAGAQPVRIVGQDVRAGIGLKEGSMVSRPPPLLAI